MTSHIDKLRAQYPELGRGFFDEMEERYRVQAKLDALREGIAFLIGYHERAGAVPVEKLQPLLNPTESEGR
jgi:hypothetical protein